MERSSLDLWLLLFVAVSCWQVDFGYIYRDSSASEVVTITNVSKVPVEYTWESSQRPEEETPVPLVDALHDQPWEFPARSESSILVFNQECQHMGRGHNVVDLECLSNAERFVSHKEMGLKNCSHRLISLLAMFAN